MSEQRPVSDMNKVVAHKTYERTTRRGDTNLDLDHLDRPLSDAIQIVERELVVLGDDLQLEGVALRPVVAPEVVPVGVQAVLVRLEGEPPRVAPPDALQRQGSALEQAFVPRGLLADPGEGANPVLEARDHPLVDVDADDGELMGVQGADRVARWEIA